MNKEERYAEHTVAWELPNRDSVTKGNYNLAGIETKYIPIQTEIVSDDKDKTIADLEAKLAESEKGKQEFLIKYKYWRTECEELKQQLAEKEKEIESYKHTVYMNMLNQEMLELKVATQHQDKISFAVEQLEKVKENILSNITFGIESVGIMNSIDNQIKQLKEGK